MMRVPAWLFFLAVFAACSRSEMVQGFPDSFVGVGLELRIEDGVPVVVRALPGGPADLAGVKTNDKVLAVDGRATDGASLGEVVMRLRGEPETQVQLSLARANTRIVVVVQRRAMAKGSGDYRPTK